MSGDAYETAFDRSGPDDTVTAAADGAPRSRRVLVAEDNDAHRLVLRRVMHDVVGRTPFELAFVADGHELLRRLRSDALKTERPPDVILLDLHMPGLSGLETLRSLRLDPRLKAIPVVILSSSDKSRHIDEAYLNGANAYLVKLGDRAELTEQMRRFASFWLDTALLPAISPR